SLRTDATQLSDVSDHDTITVVLGINPNYVVTTSDAELAIQPLHVTVPTQNPQFTKVYGDSEPPLQFQIGGITVTGTRDPGESVGSYAIHVAPSAAGRNYIVDFSGGTFTITTRPVEVTASAQTK